ncbi:MAG: sigma 54-interacting transcriptional regulator [Thermodesulfobacteriota bacterium]
MDRWIPGRKDCPSSGADLKEVVTFLSQVPLFCSLSRSSLDEIAREVHEEVYPAGTVLIRQGDPGTSFYILRSGEARVTIAADDGPETYLATLSQGECVGEMALLTGEPRAANVTLTEDSVIYTLYKDSFDRVLARDPSLYRHFTSLLVQRLKGSNVLVEREREREVALSRFLHLDPSARPPRLVGRSRLMRQIREELLQLARESCVLVLRGERGVGREMASRVVHQEGPFVHGPFVVVSCLPDRRRLRSPFSTERRSRDQMECSLFGYERGAFSGADARQMGCLELAHGGTLVIRNVENLSQALLEKISQVIRSGEFRRLGGTEPIAIQVRLIITWTDGQVPEKEEALSRFVQQVQARQVKLPPLRERKRDIPLLVEHFLGGFQRTCQGEEGLRISKEALNRLMSYDFPGNVAELESVIKRGVLLARGPEIFPEEIHLGLPREEGKAKFNLLRIPLAAGLFKFFGLRSAVRKGMAVGLLLLIALAIGGVELEVPAASMVLAITWKIWWPLLLVSVLFAGRLWCSICPVDTIASPFQRWHRTLPIPAALVRWGPWVAVGGFFSIVWVVGYFHLSTRPRETGFLLVAMVLGAIVVGLAFQRKAWCRYLCPLGTMAGVYATASLTEIHTNRSLCLSSCQTHSCYKGTDTGAGCPVYQHPLFFQNNMTCRFCLRCAEVCPNEAVQLNLRVPGEETWTMTDRPLWAAWFARMLVAFVLFQCIHSADPVRTWALKSASAVGLRSWVAYTLVLLAPLAGALLLFIGFDAITALRTSCSLGEVAAIYGLASVPLALLGHLAAKVRESLGPVPFTMILFGRHFMGGDLTKVLQGVAIAWGPLFSLFLVARLSGSARSRVGRVARGSPGLQALPSCLLALALWLLVGAA